MINRKKFKALKGSSSPFKNVLSALPENLAGQTIEAQLLGFDCYLTKKSDQWSDFYGLTGVHPLSEGEVKALKPELLKGKDGEPVLNKDGENISIKPIWNTFHIEIEGKEYAVILQRGELSNAEFGSLIESDDDLMINFTKDTKFGVQATLLVT